jgi:hypothetical protein
MNVLDIFIGFLMGIVVLGLLASQYFYNYNCLKEHDFDELTEEEKIEMREWIAHKIEKRNNNLN